MEVAGHNYRLEPGPADVGSGIVVEGSGYSVAAVNHVHALASLNVLAWSWMSINELTVRRLLLGV